MFNSATTKQLKELTALKPGDQYVYEEAIISQQRCYLESNSNVTNIRLFSLNVLVHIKLHFNLQKSKL